MLSTEEWARYAAKRLDSARAVGRISRIAFWIERLFYGLQRGSPASRLVGRETDCYLIGWLAAAAVLVALTWWWYPRLPFLLRAVLLVCAILRILDIIQAVVNVALFDRLGQPDSSREVQSVLDVTRSLVLLVWNFGELVIWFGLVYVQAAFQQCYVPLWTRFYFSAITQLTIGYGDITPLHWAKAVAVAQGTIAWMVTVIVIARFVSSLPQFRSEPATGIGAAQQAAAPDGGRGNEGRK